MNTPTDHMKDFKPGSVVQRVISLTNPYDVPLQIRLSQVDYRSFADGQSEFPPAGSLDRSNGRWIHLPCQYTTLQPKEQRDLYLTLRIPRGIPLVGSYSSLVLIEPLQNGSEKRDTTAPGFHLDVRLRYGHLVVNSFGPAETKLEIEPPLPLQINDDRYIAIDVVNQGGYFVTPTLRLNVYSGEGKLVHNQQLPPQKILPGCSSRYLVAITSLPEGSYKGIVLLHDEGKRMQTKQITFDR